MENLQAVQQVKSSSLQIRLKPSLEVWEERCSKATDFTTEEILLVSKSNSLQTIELMTARAQLIILLPELAQIYGATKNIANNILTEAIRTILNKFGNLSIEEIKEAIANLETILDTAASNITQDGKSTTFDLKAAESRLRDLRKELAKAQGKRTRRPIFNRVDLSGEN